jgi:para-nitrobenzyl esterase
MASRGCAVASISYRLTMKKLSFDCETKAQDKINAFKIFSNDTSSAVNCLLKRIKNLK